MKLTLVHLFPKLMNIYGDKGNITALRKRCEWRGIDLEVLAVDDQRDFELISRGDLFFFGGGQDRDQMHVWEQIANSKEQLVNLINERIDARAVFLLICGGYQLFGNSFLDANGVHIPGLGILNIATIAPGSEVKHRCIGNIVIHTQLDIEPQTLVGFENHGGQTKLGEGLAPLGKVVKGYGDNVHDGVEGCMYKNIFSCYMHGALLPKNPHFADYLIELALKSKYPNEKVSLKKLDDTLEMSAHAYTKKLIV